MINGGIMMFEKRLSNQQHAELSYSALLSKIAPITLPDEEVNNKSSKNSETSLLQIEDDNRWRARIGAHGSLAKSFFMIGTPASVNLDFLQ